MTKSIISATVYAWLISSMAVTHQATVDAVLKHLCLTLFVFPIRTQP